MAFKDIFKKKQPLAAATGKEKSDIVLKIHQEYQDRARKTIAKWRDALVSAEDVENPRWYLLQDLIDDLILDAHLSSVIDIRKAATLNHRFYVIDKNTKEKLEEQTDLLSRQWFYEFMDAVLDANNRKVSLMQFYRDVDSPAFDIIPRRNICPQLKRIYLKVSEDEFMSYEDLWDIIEIVHTSKFGIINDIIPNVIWKRNALQSNAEFTERFGFPLITATTSNMKDVPRIEQNLKNLGEGGTGVLPAGSEIEIHNLANAGNPETVYFKSAEFHDNQVSKKFVGSTTIVDEGANRSQTEVHKTTLDDKLALADKRTMMFAVNDKLFPVLQNLGFPFDNTRMQFQFDETEELTLTEQWKITSDAMNYYELDDEEVKKTFNLPIIKKKERSPLGGFTENFQ